MSYTVSKLITKADCTQVIASATVRKNNLLFEQTVSTKTMTDQATAVAQTTASLISVKAEITGAEAAVAALPEGKDKETYVSKLRRLNDRKDNLEDRLLKGGPAGLLETELDNTLLSLQIAELDSYLAAVTAHKATL